MSYRVHVAYAFNADRYNVHIADVGPDGVYVIKPYAFVMEKIDDGVETPAALSERRRNAQRASQPLFRGLVHSMSGINPNWEARNVQASTTT